MSDRENELVSWLYLTCQQRRLSGNCWGERCYPFRGVFPEQRIAVEQERRMLLEDFQLALQGIEAPSTPMDRHSQQH